MANPLTGDFEAVLQVSGSTVNRLLASLHQNGFSNPKLPSFPHGVQIRIGSDHAIDGVRGLVRAQVGVPRVELIHGVTDRFRLEVGVRAWFTPDYDSAPFPAFVHGTVHAEYRLEDIDPHCLGWSRNAADYLWVRVVKESVRFEGTADDDARPLDSLVSVVVTNTAAADAANVAKVTRQISGLLATRFAATPHPVGKRFRRGAMRSLNASIGGSAVATAIGLSAEPTGNIASVDNVLLDGSDLALAINVDFLMSVVSQSLDPIRAFNRSVHIHVHTPWYVPDIDTNYQVTVDPPTATWEPHDGHALIKVKVHGRAHTNSILADATFDVAQDIVLGFDAGGGSFTLSPGGSTVTVHAGGLYNGTVRSAVQSGILAQLPGVVQAACDQARPQLDQLTTRTQDLTQQLQTLDATASVGLDAAVFTVFGIVLRGTIGLGRRAAPVVQFEKLTDGSAFSALQSWIPGGRIDQFDWSWSWSSWATGEPGSAVRDDRFLLRRPAAAPSRWGIIGGTRPLPGLDGHGSVCLRVSGVRTDPVTGELVRVQSTQRCKLFSLGMGVVAKAKDGRLLLRDTSGATARTRLAEMPLVAIGAGAPPAPAANTLVVRVGERWDRETAATLAEGVRTCGRYDAGLSLLVLFRDGALDGGGRQAVAEIEEMARGLGIGVHVNEDVQGTWSRTLALGNEPVAGWAMLSPEGTAVWTHRGPLSGETLAAALDTHLRPTADASVSPLGPHREVGELVDGHMLNPDLFDETAQCPPPPYGIRGPGTAKVTFVQKGSAASLAELKGLVAGGAGADGQRPVVIAVIDGADAREAAALQSELGGAVVAIADASGTVTDRFGVAVWPTTVSLERDGTIAAIAPGGTVRAEAEHGRAASAV